MAKETKRLITPVFRVSYPNVFEAKEDLSGRMCYSIQMQFPRTDIKLLEPLLAMAWASYCEKFPKKTGKHPDKITFKEFRELSPYTFVDGDVKFNESGNDSYQGMILVNAKSNSRPGLVGPDLQPIISVEDFYAGCFARASVSCFAYDKGANKGVAFNLNNVQKMKEGNKLSGSFIAAENEFSSLEKEMNDEEIPF